MAALAKEKAVEELLGAAQKRARTDGDADLAAIIKKMRLLQGSHLIVVMKQGSKRTGAPRI